VREAQVTVSPCDDEPAGSVLEAETVRRERVTGLLLQRAERLS
jgi:hypothetical protein